MTRFITFDDQGVLKARLIENLHTIPEDAVAVSEDLWNQTIQEVDGVWRVDDEGNIAKHPHAVIVDLPAVERAWRNSELERIKWLRERHRDQQELQTVTTLSNQQFSQLLAYLQELRDWPQSDAFPDAEQRPIAPSWIIEHIN
ncbi:MULTISPECIES: phage tail assembly chaperone [unclassified Pseudomonas]|uniref:phage tail assembly chaperone n=1 Tax=unclassified Pseudomonas TaxID=196821 RepID=UPI0021C65F39|nr:MULTISPECIES: phage tail assembly chaperone [unclassified Pseudomonas]MCU1730608.1 phage tail assembly chaperone [Pseudomonas sp. 20P_3.2_Bac4]MCU1745459.1 phage tail assembly chaperone [Pseudomonas sp. 20P_3.2_Bac5]